MAQVVRFMEQSGYPIRRAVGQLLRWRRGDRRGAPGRIRTLHRALLVLRSPTDTVVIANASAILQAARHPRGVVSLEGADHLLTDGTHAKRAARIISAGADPI